MQMKLLEIIIDVRSQLLIIYAAFIRYLRKMEYNKAVH
jgi:hypothetical protein